MDSNYNLLLIALAAHFKMKLEDSFILADADFLKARLSPEELLQACELYKEDSKNTYYPKNVAVLVDLIKKPITQEDTAQNIVSKLFEYATKKGRSWKDGVLATDQKIYFEGLNEFGAPALKYTFDEALVSVFGPVGFEIVRREGGWSRFCPYANDSEKTILRPQLVRLAVSLLKHIEKTGTLDVAPLLSASSVAPLLSGGGNKVIPLPAPKSIPGEVKKDV